MEYLAQNDEWLVKESISGDSGAFEQLVGKYFGTVYAIAFARVRNRETAEDLAQEVFLRAHLFLDRLQTGTKFAPWLSQITHNLATDWFRKKQRRSELVPMLCLDEIAEIIPEKHAPNAREIMKEKEHNEALQKAIFNLPFEQREIVLLYYMENLKQREIARRLNVSPPTVHRHLKKALAAMKKSLEPILSESASSFRPSPKAVSSAIAAVAVTAGMTATAKAAIIEAAGGAAWITSISVGSAASAGLVKTILTTVGNGLSSLGIGKSLAVVVAATVIAAGGYQIHQMGGKKTNLDRVTIRPGTVSFLGWAESPEHLLGLLGEKTSEDAAGTESLDFHIVEISADASTETRESFEKISNRELFDGLMGKINEQSALKILLPRHDMKLSVDNHGGYTLSMDRALLEDNGNIEITNLGFSAE